MQRFDAAKTEERPKRLQPLVDGKQADGMTLSSDDVRWLLANNASGHLNLHGANLAGRDLTGLDFRGVRLGGANLAGAKLSRANLDDVDLAGAHLESADLRAVSAKGAHLVNAYLEAANLTKSCLHSARLQNAHLEGSTCHAARFDKANLANAGLSGGDFSGAHMEGADLSEAQVGGRSLTQEEICRIRAAYEVAYPGQEAAAPSSWEPANLQGAFFDPATNLERLSLGTTDKSGVFLTDVRWGGVNLAVVDWENCKRLGEEVVADQPIDTDGAKPASQRADEYWTASRGSRQLAARLQEQGLNREANRFALRAHTLDRKHLWFVGGWRRLSWATSWLLNLLAGYGYRPWASILAYLCTIGAFGVAYRLAARGALDWPHAVVYSVFAFHGRGIFAGTSLSDGVLYGSAGEAAVGLIVEIVLIVTFTQRMFGK